MKKILPLVLVMTVFFGEKICEAQDQHKIDSLETVLKTANEDTNKVKTLGVLAEELSGVNPDTSILLANQELQLAEKIKWQLGIGKAHVHLGILSDNKGDYTLSLEHYSKALVICDELEKKPTNPRIRTLKLKSTILGNIGTVYLKQSDYAKALDYYFKALKMDEELGNKNGIARHLGGIGVVYQEQADYLKALNYYSQALKMDQELGNKNGISRHLDNIGVIYMQLGDYPKALEHYFKALKMDEELGNKEMQTYVLSNIGEVYKEQGDYTKALEYDFKALKLDEELGQKNGIAEDLNIIATVYGEKHDYFRAQDYLYQALKMAEEIGLKRLQAYTLNNIGNLYKEQSDYPKAYDNYLKSLEVAEELKDKQLQASVLGDIGSLYLLQNKLKEAEKFLQDALKLATKIKAMDLIQDTNESLSNLYDKKEDWKRAFESYKNFISARDTINNEEKAKKQTRLEMNYEFDKKEAATKAEQDKKDALAVAEIKRQTLIRNSTLGGIGIAGIFSLLLIRSFNRRRKTSFEKQVSEVEMKALRAQMNPHFIFNSLRSINEYIQSHKTTLASEYLIKFSKLMRAILENSRQKEIVLSKEIDVLELYMQLESQRMEHPFTYTMEIDPEIDPDNTLIPPMLLQPIVENSIWHGLAPREQPGKIIIRIKKQHETIQCEVEDNGIGREVLSATNKDSKAESYGLKITAERLAIIDQIKKIKTHLTFRDLNEGGNNFTGLNVTFALPLEEAV